MPEPAPTPEPPVATPGRAEQFWITHSLRNAMWWRVGKVSLQIGLPALVIWLVAHELRVLDIRAVQTTVAGADWQLLSLGVLVAFVAVGVMGLYDAIAFPKGASGTLGFTRRWALGTVLFGWTNFVSMGPLGGPALRIFAYRRFGLSGAEITRGLIGHYVGSSSGMIAWLIAVWLPGLGGNWGMAARVLIALVGSVLIAVTTRWVLVSVFRRHNSADEVSQAPMAWLGLVSFVEWGLTLLAFLLLARCVGVEMGAGEGGRTVFTGQVAGLISMIPGGLGSADAVWFHGFKLLDVPHTQAVAAILVFRAGYYLTPWVASLAVIYTVLAMYSDRVRRWQRRFVAGAVMLNAVLLLLSAATPAIRDRLDAVARLVPLGAIELSHALATVSAAMMLLLVRGLLRGYRAAFLLTVAMLVASAIAHPLKGGDFEEAMASLILLLMLLGVRGAFTRRGRVPIGWELTIAAGVGALALFLVTGFAAFSRIPYRPELWSHFAERAEASRFLRTAVLLGLVALAAIIRQAMKPARLWVVPGEEEIDRAEAFARQHASSADPLLVGAGDKGVWFYEPTEGRTAGMVLYQRYGDKLLVFKDPVLATGVRPSALIEAFLRYTDTIDVDVVFSMISTAWMGHLHDFGYHFLKVNEEAVVPLTGFTLAGGASAGFRRTIREVEKAGVSFRIMEPPFDPDTVHRLREVSDSWLATKGGHELQFSACYFSPAYLQRNRIAVAVDGEGKIVGFINILTTRPGGPATVDFMRFIPGVVNNIMDYLLIKAMSTLAEQGYASFSLGGAPLSDVGTRKTSRLPERMLHQFSTKAERMYNYQGLHHYKSKFHPEWEARYLAYEQGWDWASALIANARLVQARSRADRKRIALARLGQAR